MNPLTPSQRRALRAKAHHLDPVVTIGHHGLTPAVLHEIDVALLAHELVKIRVFSGGPQPLNQPHVLPVRQKVPERLGHHGPDAGNARYLICFARLGVLGVRTGPGVLAAPRRRQRQRGPHYRVDRSGGCAFEQACCV